MTFISRSPDRRLLLVGPGSMGAEYARTLLHLGFSPDRIDVVGRDAERTRAFADRFGGMRPIAGGFQALAASSSLAPSPLALSPLIETAIIATPPADLAAAARAVMNVGVRRILLEKPGALSSADMRALVHEAERRDVQIFLSYNRRFFPSVARVREIIAEDGGPLAVSFDFSELECRIVNDPVTLSWGTAAMARWGLVNSSHVIDLFVHLAGMPTNWTHGRRGALPWHPTGSTFWGSGVTDRDIPFAYMSVWNGAGRWGVEVTTPRRKIVLRPLEAPTMQKNDGFALLPIDIANEPEGLKPGFLGMVQAFLGESADDGVLCSAAHASRLSALTETMLGYEISERAGEIGGAV